MTGRPSEAQGVKVSSQSAKKRANILKLLRFFEKERAAQLRQDASRRRPKAPRSKAGALDL